MGLLYGAILQMDGLTITSEFQYISSSLKVISAYIAVYLAAAYGQTRVVEVTKRKWRKWTVRNFVARHGVHVGRLPYWKNRKIWGNWEHCAHSWQVTNVKSLHDGLHCSFTGL